MKLEDLNIEDIEALGKYYDNPVEGLMMSLTFIPGSWMLFDGTIYPGHFDQFYLETDNTGVRFPFPEKGLIVRETGMVVGLVHEGAAGGD